MTPPSSPPPARGRLAIVASLFLTLVVVIAWQRHALLLPLYAGLLVWVKALVKTLTPKLLVSVVKTGLFTKGRQLLTGLFARFLVMSHRPWRRRLLGLKLFVAGLALALFRRLLGSPLWFRAGVALAVLALTATSAYAFIALLIIPQPIIDWIRVRVLAFLHKLGVTRAFDTAWRWLMPTPLRRRWRLFTKWRLGRRQVRTSQHLHRRVERRLQRELARRARH